MTGFVMLNYASDSQRLVLSMANTKELYILTHRKCLLLRLSAILKEKSSLYKVYDMYSMSESMEVCGRILFQADLFNLIARDSYYWELCFDSLKLTYSSVDRRGHGLHRAEELHPQRPESCQHPGQQGFSVQNC